MLHAQRRATSCGRRSPGSTHTGCASRRRRPPLTNGVLLGSLIVPLGFSQAGWPAWMEDDGRPGLNLGVLPLAAPGRRADPPGADAAAPPARAEPVAHARRMLMQRSAFADALTWLEIHGDAPEKLAYWREQAGGSGRAGRGRRRRRPSRSRRRPAPGPAALRLPFPQGPGVESGSPGASPVPLASPAPAPLQRRDGLSARHAGYPRQL
ncbi:MAG: hypothetical protein MZV49_25770 [Rhodopseudomonas palustris]|nr:hypothetical protein [Rhodopseudomonas palustris]